MSDTRRTILRRSLALALGLALAFGLVEVGYRLARLPGLSPTTHPSYVRHDPELGWSYRPGARGRHRSPAFDVAVEVNAEGFRGPDWPAPSGRTRVLVLGDSFAFGWGVEHAETFGARLAEATGWDVLNASVSGYGTGQQRLVLERLVDAVEPDLVVSVFCWNDLFETSSSAVYGKRKPRYALGPDGTLELAGVPVPAAGPARWSLALQGYLKWRWQRAHARRVVDRDAEWRLVLALYREERRLLGDVPLLVVSDRGRLAVLARETDGIEHLDLREVFAGFEGETVFPDDGHWVPEAHAAIARALERKAREVLRAED